MMQCLRLCLFGGGAKTSFQEVQSLKSNQVASMHLQTKFHDKTV